MPKIKKVNIIKYKRILKRILSNPYFWLALIVFIYFLPMLLYPQFSYIDDGYTLITSKKIISSNFSEVKKMLFESHIGRMRPAYYVYFTFLYLITGPSALGFWVARALIIFLTLAGFYKLTTSVKQKNIFWPHVLLIGFFLLLPQVAENTYRLGPAETQQAVFIVWFFVLLKKTWKKIPSNLNIVWINLLFAGAIFTKETAIILAPLFFIYFLLQIIFIPKLRKSKKMWFLALTLFSQTAFFFHLLPARQGYASSFVLIPSKLWYQFLVSRFHIAEYYLLLLIAGIGTGIRLFLAVYKNKFKSFLLELTWQLMFLGGFIMSLIFVFSWEHQLGRYYYLTLIFLWLYLLKEMVLFKKIYTKLKKLPINILSLTIGISLGILVSSYFTVFQKQGLSWDSKLGQTEKSLYNWFRGYQTGGSLIHFLLHELPDDTVIYTTATDYEPLINMGYYSSKLGERTIIIHSNNPMAEEKHSESHVYVKNVLNSFKIENSPKVLITSNSAIPEIDNYEDVVILRPPAGILNKEINRFWRIQKVYEK